MGNSDSTPREQCENAESGWNCWLCNWAASASHTSPDAFCLYCSCMGSYDTYMKMRSIRPDESPYYDGVGGACSIDFDCDDGDICLQFPDDSGGICVDPKKIDVDSYYKAAAEFEKAAAAEEFPQIEKNFMTGLNSGNLSTGNHSASPVSVGFLVAGVSMLALIVGLKKIRGVGSQRGYEEVPLVQE